MWRVIGQDKVLSSLDYSLKTGSTAHAYLLLGPRQVGKGTLAVDLAQALNCDGPDLPCGRCHSCQRILGGKHADVTPAGLDSKTEIGIDDIRGLQRLASLPPYEGRCKVFIITDADYLSNEAANALLKVLEEPADRVVWLLLAAEEKRLLPTIMSRCQRLELKPVPQAQCEEALINRFQTDGDRAKLLSRLCHGRLGWALSALRDEAILERRHERLAGVLSLSSAGVGERFAYAQELADEFGRDRRAGSETMELWRDWWHDLMLIKGGHSEAVTNVDWLEALHEQAGHLSLSEIGGFLTDLGLLEDRVHRNVNPRLAFEWLMLGLPRKT